ncbi:Exocyst complex component 8 [Geodia barretti]|uniref:Exocyst complex component 8 n=1 Tax=Geodia barretti TaxID=519541 RepID=A0AA35SZP4_GEOBA|nr:Exocyst complex component 8 [Geodia barretti]
MGMENLGVKDFKNKIRGGGVIDLSQTTITFCRLLINFVDDVRKLYIPELLISIFECFCDIFKHIVDLYVDAFGRDENVPVGDFITADAQFVVDTLLPTVGKIMNEWTCVQISDFVDLHNSLLVKIHKLAGDGGNDQEQQDDADSEDVV